MTDPSRLAAYYARRPNFSPADLSVQRLETLETERSSCLTSNTYFEGGDVLVCHAGSFRFSFLGERTPVDLGVGEVLVLYPGNTVTIVSGAGRSRLKYAIFNGARVADFFDGFGFYNRLKFCGETQETLFDRALEASGTDMARTLAYLTDALTSFAHEIQTGPQRPLHAAHKAMHQAVRDGHPNIKSVCAYLGVSRATLNRTFDTAGTVTPRDYLLSCQTAYAVRLLTTTDMPVADIARAVGISSPSYFTAFMRRQTGLPPHAHRNGCL